jgi:hypothetical protein
MTSTADSSKPEVVNVCPTNNSCAHSYGHVLMYWMDASASIGMTETIAIQFAHALMNPTSAPCE